MWTRDIDPPTQRALELLGEEIRRARMARGWTQRRLADYCGVAQSTICRLECGLAPGLRTEAIARVRAALGPFFGR